MKTSYYLTVIFFFLMMLDAKAQEIIFKRSGEQIKALVTEINVDNIKYKDWANQAGAVQTILKSQVLKIKYADGTEDLMNATESKPITASKPATSNSSSSNYPAPKSSANVPAYQQNKAEKTAPVAQQNTPKPQKSYSEKSERHESDSKPLFFVLGVNYLLQPIQNGQSGVGLNLGIGYKFTESLGVMASLEPNYIFRPSGVPSSVDVGVNLLGTLYPAVVYKVIPKIYLYGGLGGYGTYNSKATTKNLNAVLGYSGGVMVDITEMIGVKAGYYNAVEGGNSASGYINVGLFKSLNW
jgi:hypothetical protein